MKAKVAELINEPKFSEKEDEEKNNDRSKFKKVKMPVFNGDDPDV